MTTTLTTEAFICDAIRTPFGKYGGILSSIRTDDLAAIPIEALLDRNPGLSGSFDDVYLGCANQAGEDNRNVARMAVLLSGLPARVPGMTINRLCGSGLDAIGTAARAIKSGELGMLIAGGVESMSRAPYVMGKGSSQFDRSQVMYDTTMGWRFINPALEEDFGVDTMIQTAENVAAEWKITRDEQDLFAYNSQLKAYNAQMIGEFSPIIGAPSFFDAEICTVQVSTKKEDFHYRKDEHPRLVTMEALSKMKPIIKGGTVTAGNASGINDGAAAMIIANERSANLNQLTPKAAIVAMATSGVLPKYMGIGAAAAAARVLAQSGLTLKQMDVIELNEAFAAQSLACLKDLGLDYNDPRVNPNGGAIALGHPLGASGARIVMTAINQLNVIKGKYALCTMCVGVGQGIALIIERI
jgi:3-oxoadipyl-CoA thiolase